MRQFKYVEFSRNTAKRNPEMIRDAYTKLIDQTQEKLTVLTEKQFSIRFYAGGDLINRLKYEKPLNSYEPFEIEVSANEILKIADQIKIKYHTQLGIKEELTKIREEYFRFNQRFHYGRQL